MKKLSMVKAREQLTRLPEALRGRDKPVTLAVTRHGEPVLAILPWELYEGVIETLEVLSDRELMQSLARSLEDIRKGRLLTTEQLRRELGLE